MSIRLDVGLCTWANMKRLIFTILMLCSLSGYGAHHCFYEFEDAAFADLSGNENAVTNSGGTFVDGAIKFSTPTSHVVFATTSNLNFSVVTRIRFTNKGGYRALYGEKAADTNSNPESGIYIQPSSGDILCSWGTSNNYEEVIFENTGLSAGIWHDVVFTCESGTVLKVYWAGRAPRTVTMTQPRVPRPDAFIGSPHLLAPAYTRQRSLEFAWYCVLDTALSEVEARGLSRGGVASAGAELRALGELLLPEVASRGDMNVLAASVEDVADDVDSVETEVSQIWSHINTTLPTEYIDIPTSRFTLENYSTRLTLDKENYDEDYIVDVLCTLINLLDLED